MSMNTGNIQYRFWDFPYSQHFSLPVRSMPPSYRLELPKDEQGRSMARDKDLPQIWQSYGGGGGSGVGGRYLRDMTESEIAAREAQQKPYADMLARQQAYENRYIKQPQSQDAKPDMRGCVFAKSCNLPDGIIDHKNPAGFVPVEKLTDYGMWAVLGTGAAITAQGTPLQLVGGSATGSAIAERLGGSLALTLLEGSTVVGAGFLMGSVGLLVPNTSISPDSAFYTNEQYATLEAGRTRVRVNVKTLPDGAINAYGFYTGGKTDWENVPVIKAAKEGEKYLANIGNGVALTWTPAASTVGVLGIPALEGVSPLPSVWVYPPTEQANKILVNPKHPPDYQDAIISFPNTGIQPIYISLSISGDHSYHPAPKGLTAFPDAVKVDFKTRVQGGGGARRRWKDGKGRIYEWDSQHGAIEMYDKQGKHLGEFDPVTGEQTKPAKPGRKVEK